MTKEEALITLSRGEKVTHILFQEGEWVRLDGVHNMLYVFEDGATCTPEEFWGLRPESYWDTGWSIYHG